MKKSAIKIESGGKGQDYQNGYLNGWIDACQEIIRRKKQNEKRNNL